jgi:hypothetical protein
MVRVTLIGAGNVDFHYKTLLGFSDEKLTAHLDSIARALVSSGSELLVTPDDGVSFDIAKKYKFFGGKKVTGLVPVSDKRWGTKHIDKYLSEKINGKKVLDEVIDTLNWLEHDSTHNLFGDVTLCLAFSVGAMRELCGGYYLYKLFSGEKPEARIALERVNPKIVAGTKMPFHTIIYSSFVQESLPKEIEKYIGKYGCKVFYVGNAKELEGVLVNLPKTP